MMTPAAPALPISAPLERWEEQLDLLLPGVEVAPTVLHRAMRHAVFPAGKRIRPRLLFTVASACAAGAGELQLAVLAGCAVELIHSASLVHDDLPCFDDAPLRRGRPSVHALYGEAIAVLTGDALLTRAFETLADAPARLARRALRIVSLLGQATGSQRGIIGGQSLETMETLPTADAGGLGAGRPEEIERYHAMKTGALFRLAAEAGATAAGATDTAAWGEVGQSLGLAYQIADDLCDVCGDEGAAGKPVGRDAALGRPNAVLLEGERAARARVGALLERAQVLATALAVDPTPLTQLLCELRGHFLRVSPQR